MEEREPDRKPEREPERGFGPEALELVAGRFRVLGEPNRLRILRAPSAEGARKAQTAGAVGTTESVTAPKWEALPARTKRCQIAWP